MCNSCVLNRLPSLFFFRQTGQTDISSPVPWTSAGPSVFPATWRRWFQTPVPKPSTWWQTCSSGTPGRDQLPHRCSATPHLSFSPSREEGADGFFISNLHRLSGTPTSTWARLWALLSRSWSREGLSRASCHCSHLCIRSRCLNRSSRLCSFSRCLLVSLRLLTNTAHLPGLSSRSSPPPLALRPTSGTPIWCGSSNQSTCWSRSNLPECHRGICRTLSTTVFRARWRHAAHERQKRLKWQALNHTCILLLWEAANEAGVWKFQPGQLSNETQGELETVGPQHGTL